MVARLLLLCFFNSIIAGRVAAPPRIRTTTPKVTVADIELERNGFDLVVSILEQDIRSKNGDPVDRKNAFADRVGGDLQRWEARAANSAVFADNQSQEKAREALAYMRQQQRRFESLADGHSRPQPPQQEPVNRSPKKAEQLCEEQEQLRSGTAIPIVQPQKQRRITWIIPTALIAGGIYWFTKKPPITRKRKPKHRMLKACDAS